MLKPAVLAGVLALIAPIMVAPAGAQTGADQTKLTVKAKVTPNKAGTKRNPRGVTLRVQATWDHPAGVERPVISRAFVWSRES